MLTVCSENRISIPSEITMLAKGIVTLESVLYELSPKTNILKITTDYLVSHSMKIPKLKEIIRTQITFFRALEKSGRASMKLPITLGRVLDVVGRGKSKVNIELTGSREPLAAISKMINRLVMGIITAALLIGSSFLATTNMNPKILGIPALALFGFVASFCLSVWIIVQMFLQDRRLDKRK